MIATPAEGSPSCQPLSVGEDQGLWFQRNTVMMHHDGGLSRCPCAWRYLRCPLTRCPLSAVRLNETNLNASAIASLAHGDASA